MSSRLTDALLAADVLGALVLCGLSLDVSIPESVRTDLTQRLTVSLLPLFLITNEQLATIGFLRHLSLCSCQILL